MTLARLRPLPSSATSTGPTALTVEAFADAAGIDAEVVRRFVALGLLDPMPGVRGELRFPPAQLAVAARIRRLRAGLGLNYAALGLVMDLLDRIARLELALRNVGASGGTTTRPPGARRETRVVPGEPTVVGARPTVEGARPWTSAD
jgi:hypothetical protein